MLAVFGALPGYPALFDDFNLGVTPDMPFFMGFVSGVQKGGDQLLRQRRTDNPAAEADHVHVVVFNALMSRIRIVHQRGIDAGDLVGSDARADAAPADDDAAFGAAIYDMLRDRFGKIRIINGDVGGGGSNINDVMLMIVQVIYQNLFEGKSCVIAADGEFHTIALFVGGPCFVGRL